MNLNSLDDDRSRQPELRGNYPGCLDIFPLVMAAVVLIFMTFH